MDRHHRGDVEPGRKHVVRCVEDIDPGSVGRAREHPVFGKRVLSGPDIDPLDVTDRQALAPSRLADGDQLEPRSHTPKCSDGFPDVGTDATVIELPNVDPDPHPPPYSVIPKKKGTVPFFRGIQTPGGGRTAPFQFSTILRKIAPSPFFTGGSPGSRKSAYSGSRGRCAIASRREDPS